MSIPLRAHVRVRPVEDRARLGISLLLSSSAMNAISVSDRVGQMRRGGGIDCVVLGLRDALKGERNAGLAWIRGDRPDCSLVDPSAKAIFPPVG
jgi:hypothetical protein